MASPSAQRARNPSVRAFGEGEQILGRGQVVHVRVRVLGRARQVMIMTRDKDFKARVRARMRRTGESYTAARSALEAMPSPEDRCRQTAEREQQRIVSRWFDSGRLRDIPARRKMRAAVMLEVLSRFEPGPTYSEPEVRKILEPIHPDFASLRRELISLGYLNRDNGRYWVCVIAEHERRELPAWEAVWLPDFAARATDFRPERRVS